MNGKWCMWSLWLWALFYFFIFDFHLWIVSLSSLMLCWHILEFHRSTNSKTISIFFILCFSSSFLVFSTSSTQNWFVLNAPREDAFTFWIQSKNKQTRRNWSKLKVAVMANYYVKIIWVCLFNFECLKISYCFYPFT